MKNFLARLIGAYDNRRDRRAWQASTSEPDLIDGDAAAAPPAGSDVYGACTVDDEPVPVPGPRPPVDIRPWVLGANHQSLKAMFATTVGPDWAELEATAEQIIPLYATAA